MSSAISNLWDREISSTGHLRTRKPPSRSSRKTRRYRVCSLARRPVPEAVKVEHERRLEEMARRLGEQS